MRIDHKGNSHPWAEFDDGSVEIYKGTYESTITFDSEGISVEDEYAWAIDDPKLVRAIASWVLTTRNRISHENPRC